MLRQRKVAEEQETGKNQGKIPEYKGGEK